MRYFKQRKHSFRCGSLVADWGECVLHVEIGDDRYAVRQIEVYSGGRVLRYDRSHWCDKFGQLIGCLFSLKQKAIDGQRGAEVIDAKEFERAWREALSSPMWGQQVEQSLASEWGTEPDWLQAVQVAEQAAAPGRGGITTSRGSRSPRRRGR